MQQSAGSEMLFSAKSHTELHQWKKINISHLLDWEKMVILK